MVTDSRQYGREALAEATYILNTPVRSTYTARSIYAEPLTLASGYIWLKNGNRSTKLLAYTAVSESVRPSFPSENAQLKLSPFVVGF